jgi:lipopolysaccharide transport system permease protein
LALPLSTVLSSLIDFGVALIMLAVLMAVYHIMPGPGLLLLPVWLAGVLFLGVGIGLAAAALTVSYRDIQYVLPVVTQFLMYASPVAYSASAVPSSLRFIYFLNPLSGLLEGFRASLLNRGMIPWPYLLYSLGFSIAALLCGVYAFKRMEKKFADVI